MTTVYRTYYTGTFDKSKIRTEIIPDVFSSFMAKPCGGLWGCRGDEWYNWCKMADFRTYEPDHYFEWSLKDTARLFYIDTDEDVKKFFSYNKVIPELPKLSKSNIDWERLRKDFDAVEISLNTACFCRIMDNDLIGFSAWDVPSIVVLNNGVVDLIGDKACQQSVCF